MKHSGARTDPYSLHAFPNDNDTKQNGLHFAVHKRAKIAGEESGCAVPDDVLKWNCMYCIFKLLLYCEVAQPFMEDRKWKEKN